MIDLHLHTNYSDGTDSVSELLNNAQSSNLEIISITDHDSIDAYKEIENNKQLLELYNGKIITGVEYNKYMSGGSDYHADFKPNVKMGTGINNNLNVSKEFVNDWVSKIMGVSDRNKI